MKLPSIAPVINEQAVSANEATSIAPVITEQAVSTSEATYIALVINRRCQLVKLPSIALITGSVS